MADTRKWRGFVKKLNAILGMYGVNGRTETGRSKKDAFLDEFLDVIAEQVSDQVCGYAKQLCIDASCSVLTDPEGPYRFGVKKWQNYEERLRNRMDEFDVLAEEETADNIRNNNYEANGKSDVVHLKADIDKAVRAAYGEYFLEYDARYYKSQCDEHQHSFADIREMVERHG